MAARITKRMIDGLKPGQIIFDESLKGFGARRRSDAISYFVKYRVGTGRAARQRWFILGKHGALTPAQARKAASKVLLRVSQGEDPAATREHEQGAQTVADLWELYRKRHGLPAKKPRTLAEDDALARDYIVPAFGKRRASEVSRQDVARWHASMSVKPARANRALALLRSMFTKAEAWGLRPENSNPASRIKKYPERARNRYLSADELSRLGGTFDDFLERNACPPQAIALLQVLLFTGMRLNEALTLKWPFVDLEAGVLRLPDSKTGPKTVRLPPPAQSILMTQLRLAGNEYVFPGLKPGQPLKGIQNIWQRIRADAQLSDVRIHDFRHGFASIAVQSGESLYLVGKALGHRQSSTTERYAHLNADPIKVLSDGVASKVEDALAGRGRNRKTD
jgi:integrase